MKKLTLILAIIITTGSTVFAQRNIDNRDQQEERSEIRIHFHELRDFEREMDQFSYAMLAGDQRLALRTKVHILDDMEREVTQNEFKLLILTKEFGTEVEEEVTPQRRRSTGRLESRENGQRDEQRALRREIQEVRNQLEKQKRLLFLFEDTVLIRRGRIVNENDHRRLMYQFKETMRDDLVETR